jgi:CRP/FNR family cyclic AMP-dependent transcriptional regulator
VKHTQPAVQKCTDMPVRTAYSLYIMATKGTRAARHRDGRLLASLNVARTRVRFGAAETIFVQGDRCDTVMYLERGRVRLSVVSPGGRTKVVAMLRTGSLFGEGALAGQRLRRSTAEAMTDTTIVIVKTAEMRQQLHAERSLSDWFRSHLLASNNRIEADLVADAFNKCETRLARALLLLAGAADRQSPRYPMPKISRDLLAEMTDMPRSRVDSLMNDFRKHGFLERNSERNGGLQVHQSLLNLVLQN